MKEKIQKFYAVSNKWIRYVFYAAMIVSGLYMVFGTGTPINWWLVLAVCIFSAGDWYVNRPVPPAPAVPHKTTIEIEQIGGRWHLILDTGRNLHISNAYYVFESEAQKAIDKWKASAPEYPSPENKGWVKLI